MPYFVADGSERMVDVTIHADQGRDRTRAVPGPDRASTSPTASAPRPIAQKFVTLVENSTDFIGMCDLQGVPFFVNRAGLEMVGLDEHRAGAPDARGGLLLPGGSAQASWRSSSPRCSRQGHGEIEVRFRHFKTGEARWMAYKVLTLPDAAGRPMAFATVSQDVTERRRLDDDLRTLGGDLSEANRRKNEFLAMLAHELRNPLAPISNAVRALRVGRRRCEGGARGAGMLERQVGQLARLVDDLLDLSRITRGKIELRKQRVELAPIVEQAVEAGARALRQSRPRADGDAAAAARLSERRSRAPGAGDRQPAQQRVQVHRPGRPHRADGRARRRAGGRRACATTASASRAEQLPHLFEMFTQVDTSLERSRDGLGIGLTLVKALVEMHGGTVEARSEGLGRGSEFEVRLPALARTLGADRAGRRARADDDAWAAAS